MKTRSNRISAVQRRAKRRVILIAIGAAAFAGYSAVALFASDGKQDVVEELSKVPAVRAVGIRLLNPAGDKQEKKIELSLPPSTTTLPSSAALPNTLALPAPSLPSNPISLPPASPLPTPMGTASAATPQRNLELLAPPPRMPETVSKAAPGKVTVRLASDKKDMPTENATQGPSNSQKLPDGAFVNIHMTPVQPQDLTTKAHSTSTPNAPQLKPASLVEPPKVASKGDSQPETVRMKLGDSGLVELQTISPAAPASPVLALPVPRPRNPELVKPQRFQVSEAVTLASAPDMDAPLIDESATDENGTTAGEQDSIALSPVELVVSTPKKSNLSTPASSVVGQPLPMVSLAAPPTDMENAESTNSSSGVNDQKSAAKPSVNYDSRWSKASPVATIEMESQSATALEIPGNVRAVAVENEDVCRVLHTERTISIVGSKQGSSLIQVWTTELKDAPQVLRVNVSQPWQTPNANSGDLKEVKQALAQAFPRSNLKLLKQDDGTLEVRGTTENEETARRVLEMVRKLCLVPVKDKVTVLR